jgi:hypothetical protein
MELLRLKVTDGCILKLNQMHFISNLINGSPFTWTQVVPDCNAFDINVKKTMRVLNLRFK